MDSIVDYGAQVKCRDCYTMIPVDRDTDDAPVTRRRCPSAFKEPTSHKCDAVLASIVWRNNDADLWASLRTVAELKAKYGPTFQVDGVVEDDYDDGTVDTTNTPQSAAPQTSGHPRGSKNKEKASEAVELPQRPATPSKNCVRPGSSLESTPRPSGRRKARAYDVGGSQYNEPSHSHRQPSVEDEVENEEEEEAASHQGSQHSEESAEVADILEKAAPRQKQNDRFQELGRSTSEAAITRRSNRVTGVRRSNGRRRGLR
jgi:hypothetical protein